MISRKDFIMTRKAGIERKTTETDVLVKLNLDGSGKGDISSTLPFLDHMLNLFAKHGFFDLTLKSKGDTDIDDHHLVEDIGICMGEVFKKALGSKAGIARYGSATVPMDESLCSVSADISGRPYLVYHANFSRARIGTFDSALLKEFFKSFSDHSGITLHINLLYGRNNHHMAEAIFKAFARALSGAAARDQRIAGVLSTKGSL